MKKLVILLCAFLSTFSSFSQDEKSIVMNDSLIEKYFVEFVHEANQRGLDVQDELVSKIDYILIVPENVEVKNLAEFDEKIKFIKLSNDVLLDRLILKINLFRELSHLLGVPYDMGSVIMNRDKKKGFSYSCFDDDFIMQSELTRIMAHI